jgi:small GTP-binding protein
VQLNDGTIIKLYIIDTAGQERYNSLTEGYYRQADCCLLMYDITSRKSFEKIEEYYIGQIKEYCRNDIKIILLGNKTDLEDQRKVSQDEGQNLAKENEYIFMESSCKDNYNVSDAFTALVEMTNTDIKKGIRDGTSKKNGDKLKKSHHKKQKCC